MKRLFIIGAALCLLTGCGAAEEKIETEVETTEIVTEVTTEESKEEFPKGYFNYSKEYIEELYCNTIDNLVTQNEWEELEKNHYWSDDVIMYALLQKYGEIK